MVYAYPISISGLVDARKFIFSLLQLIELFDILNRAKEFWTIGFMISMSKTLDSETSN